MYIKQIEQLVILQGVDNEILEIEEIQSQGPLELESLQQKGDELDARRAEIQDKVETLKAQKIKLGKDIEEDDFKIKKSKNKLMMVENTKEYHAMLREMDNLEKMNRMREEEMASLAEELTIQEAELERVSEEHEQTSLELQEKRSALEDQLEECNKKIKKLNKKREKARKTIPAPILGRYEFIRSRINNPVIVSVTEGVCDGCHISIPPQSYIELQKGQQILSCPNCQRLIYWSEHFESEERRKAENE
ncbi:MAG: zinc ribbon domain-containing protein [Desulfovibrionales bacterium]